MNKECLILNAFEVKKFIQKNMLKSWTKEIIEEAKFYMDAVKNGKIDINDSLISVLSLMASQK
jgi:hypothetical protein